jgi:hypothetical protein
VPAISRCAQVYLRVKFSRKAAAVHEAPPGVPMLARSAKFDFSCSLYSSPIGRRHAVSLAFLPAAMISSASLLWASSSRVNRPLLWWPRATMQAPVSVAMSITAAGLKRSA